MIIGIVGSEAAKFTNIGEERARTAIWEILDDWLVEEVVSGGCHLGGIDIWAMQAGKHIPGMKLTEFLPESRKWIHYKKRNLQIAQRSDVVYCITVKNFPKEYQGMKFPYCYHCKTDAHIKSGGCWTVKQAIKMGKVGEVIVVDNY